MKQVTKREVDEKERGVGEVEARQEKLMMILIRVVAKKNLVAKTTKILMAKAKDQ